MLLLLLLWAPYSFSCRGWECLCRRREGGTQNQQHITLHGEPGSAWAEPEEVMRFSLTPTPSVVAKVGLCCLTSQEEGRGKGLHCSCAHHADGSWTLAIPPVVVLHPQTEAQQLGKNNRKRLDRHRLLELGRSRRPQTANSIARGSSVEDPRAAHLL